jgi:alcohol dehydrogenase YqhD (iron-dependent ADH family)
MLNFIYNAPTKIYFGKDTHKKVGQIIKELGYDKIMLQYGKGSIKKSGLYDDVMTSLNENGIKVVEMGGVEPNPKVEFVREAVKLAKKEKVQMILAVGGGSVIDSSKCTALGVKNDCDIWDIQMGKVVPKEALKTACILTISAAGSEMSNSAVLTNSQLNMKKGVSTELNRCEFAILNPELTFSVNKYQTSCGIVDMMTHTLERYFTNHAPTDLTDRISESIIKSIILAGDTLMDDLTNYEARATIMWASSLSHNGLTGCGRENALAVHQLEHALSGEYDSVAHGAGLAVLFPAWAKYVYKYSIDRFYQFATNVWGVKGEDKEKVALKGIEEMAKFFKQLKMPSRLSEFKIEKNSADRLAYLCTFGKTRTIKNYITLDYQVIKEIFESCM